MPGLSKSKLMAFLQCPKRLWLDVHRPDLAPPVDAETQARFDLGHQVGDIARRLYDPDRTGTLIGYDGGMPAALRATAEALAAPGDAPLFEATFERDGLLVRTDVLERRGATRMIEVKSSASCKPEHVQDCAIQAWVLESSPARPAGVALAHIDSTFVYPGNGEYAGLLCEEDLTAELAPDLEQVPRWLAAAKATLAAGEPAERIGSRCFAPYECPYVSHCWPETEYPLTSLPGVGRRLDDYLAAGFRDVRDIPEDQVSGAAALRAWRAARSGEATVSHPHRDLVRAFPYPRYFLDFETVSPAVPLWAGMGPYQLVPFQWSLHVETAPGRLEHVEYLDLSGELPARGVSEALLKAVGPAGPVFMYTGYERTCLNALAGFCPDLAEELQALSDRLVDLHPLVKDSFCHPAMRGSWSIKAVLPAIAPEMDYALLPGIQDGSTAQLAYLEAIAPATTPGRKEELREQLVRYCGHDTLAMVRVAGFLAGSG